MKLNTYFWEASDHSGYTISFVCAPGISPRDIDESPLMWSNQSEELLFFDSDLNLLDNPTDLAGRALTPEAMDLFLRLVVLHGRNYCGWHPIALDGGYGGHDSMSAALTCAKEQLTRWLARVGHQVELVNSHPQETEIMVPTALHEAIA